MIKELVYQAIDEINNEFSLEIKKERTTKLIGEIDSLTLVNLLVIIEDKINKTYDKTFMIADDRAMSRKNSPFKDVDSLINYLIEII